MAALTRIDVQRRLEAEGIAVGREALNVADWIWRDILGFHRQDVVVLTETQADRIEEVFLRLRGGEPIQYIAGHAYFYGYRFAVTPDTLIPRPETEELVAWAIEVVRSMKANAVRILDIGTGAGCIAIALALKLGQQVEMHAMDISAGALDVARANAAALGASVSFVRADFLKEGFVIPGPFDLIISNPPYVDPDLLDDATWNALRHEPQTALVAPGSDPDIFYRQLSLEAGTVIHPEHGCVLVELNEFRAERIQAIFQADNWVDVEVRSDLSGYPRMLLARRFGYLNPA